MCVRLSFSTHLYSLRFWITWSGSSARCTSRADWVFLSSRCDLFPPASSSGRYRKNSRELSQSRWIVNNKRKVCIFRHFFPCSRQSSEVSVHLRKSGMHPCNPPWSVAPLCLLLGCPKVLSLTYGAHAPCPRILLSLYAYQSLHAYLCVVYPCTSSSDTSVHACTSREREGCGEVCVWRKRVLYLAGSVWFSVSIPSSN